MTSRDFCYWLQGYFEIENTSGPLNTEQVKLIRKHLNMAFKHEIDPSFGQDNEALNEIHSAPFPGAHPGDSPNPIIRC